MSDYVIIRIPFDKPDKPKIVKFLPTVPIDWKKYLEKTVKKEKKEGRYVVANLVYDIDCFYPKKKKKVYKKIEKRTEKKA